MVYPTLEVTIPLLLAGVGGAVWLVRSIERVGTKVDGIADNIRFHVANDHGLINERLDAITDRIDGLRNGRYTNGT
jgi:hypothetical protein